MSLFNSSNHKSKNVLILAGALFYFCSCSVNPNHNAKDNLFISFQYGSEPLLTNVNSANLTVINNQNIIAFDTTFIISPSSGDIPQFDIQIQEESGLTVRAWFFDEPRRPLYRALRFAALAGNSPSIVILDMVQSGYLSGTRVKILRDEPPWDSFALDSTLAEIGLTEGTAGNQFNVCPSFDLPSIDLDSGNDLLIISNDQPQGFYDNLAINMEMVIDFIRAGGTVLWETCDLAWNYGSYAAAGLDTLPGQIAFRTAYDPINITVDPHLGMVGGLEDTLAGIYASNKYLSNVPDSAIIYMTNSTGYPTLVGLRYGYGLIFYSGQPLEYNFDRRDEYNMGFLLPRILHFMLGKPWEESSLYSFGGDVNSRPKSTVQN
jgi:hypothetical protein